MMEGESADELSKICDNQFDADETIGEEKGHDVGKICPEYEISSVEIRSDDNSQIIISQIVEYVLEGVCRHGSKVLNDENIIQEEVFGEAAAQLELDKTLTRDTTGGEHENLMTTIDKPTEGQMLCQMLSKDTAENQNINYKLISEDQSFESERGFGKCSLAPKNIKDGPSLDKCTDRDQKHDTAGEFRVNGSHILEQVILESHAFNETACVPNETIPENDIEFKVFNNGVMEDQIGRLMKKLSL